LSFSDVIYMKLSYTRNIQWLYVRIVNTNSF